MEKDLKEKFIREFLAKDFVWVMAPNEEDVAEIVKKSKGNRRSLREFSKVTGISLAKLSRIVNGQISRPLSVDTIIDIALNSELDSPKVISDLARANGYMSKTEHSKFLLNAKLRDARDEHFELTESFMRTIIIGEMLQRGLKFDWDWGDLLVVSGQRVKYNLDLMVATASESYKWVFFCYPQSVEDFKTEGFTAEKISNIIFRDISSVLLTDAWMPKQYENYKISFCFLDKAICDKFFQTINYGQFNNEFSVISFDSKGEKLECEYTLQGKTKRESLLDLPIVKPAHLEFDKIYIDAF